MISYPQYEEKIRSIEVCEGFPIRWWKYYLDYFALAK
jgi:hypothetical protein